MAEQRGAGGEQGQGGEEFIFKALLINCGQYQWQRTGLTLLM